MSAGDNAENPAGDAAAAAAEEAYLAGLVTAGLLTSPFISRVAPATDDLGVVTSKLGLFFNGHQFTVSIWREA